MEGEGLLLKIKENTSKFEYQLSSVVDIPTSDFWESEWLNISTTKLHIQAMTENMTGSIQVVFSSKEYPDNPSYTTTVTLFDITSAENHFKGVIDNFPTNYFKIKVNNTYASARELSSLLLWKEDISDSVAKLEEINVTVAALNTKYDKIVSELTRPKHTQLARKKLTIASGVTITAADIFGDTNEYLEGNQINVSDFSFIYFAVHIDTALVSGSYDYYLQNWFIAREQTGAETKFNRADFDGYSNDNGSINTSEPWVKVIDSTERYAFTDWIPVTGTHINTYFKNEGAETIDPVFAIIGIR